jgi:dethiobiotin synthetase
MIYSKIFFVTGIGTDVGKTVAAGIISRALEADYWKPIQAGYDGGTDSERIRSVVQTSRVFVQPEVYRLQRPASPHIAARDESVRISIDEIVQAYKRLTPKSTCLVIEGAGGLLVPVNETQFISDIIVALGAKVILVSRNYLGSINHSLLTAEVCRQRKLDVAGWVFNDQVDGLADYEDEIVRWSGYPKLASVPHLPVMNAQTIDSVAASMRENLLRLVN